LFWYVENDKKRLITCLDHLGRHFKFVEASANGRLINGILGLLCREHFPGLVLYRGKREPAYSYRHYEQADDTVDRAGRRFANKAIRVVEELWVSLQIIALLN
jgi:hypothetical protein